MVPGQKTRSFDSKKVTNFGRKKRKRKYWIRGPRAVALNEKIIACENPFDILDLLVSTRGALTRTAGGGVLSHVNFCTSVHRISRHVSRNSNHQQARKDVLSEPRYALLLASLAESFAGANPNLPLSSLQDERNSTMSNFFRLRELTNLLWSFAKLRFVPPKSVVPIRKGNHEQVLISTSFNLRAEVLKSRQTGKVTWIPALSMLSGELCDAIGERVMALSGNNATTQEIASLLWSFSKLQRNEPHIFETLVQMLVRESKHHKIQPQELSNSVWALAHSRMVVGDAPMQILEMIAKKLEEDPSFAKEFGTQELANTAWGVATILSNRRSRTGCGRQGPKEDAIALVILRFIAKELIERADQFNQQEIANTVWAFATLGFGRGEKALVRQRNMDHVHLVSDNIEGDFLLMDKSLSAAFESAMKRISRFRNQELNNMAWASGRLERQDPKLFAAIARELSQPHRNANAQDIAATLWGFANTGFSDDECFRMLASNLRPEEAHLYKTREHSNICWAMGTVGIKPKYLHAFETSLPSVGNKDIKAMTLEEMADDPITLCFAAAAEKLRSHPEQFIPQEIKDTLWGFTRVGLRHPTLFREMAEYFVGKVSDTVPPGKWHCGRGLDDVPPHIMSTLLLAYAKHAQLTEGLKIREMGRMAVYVAMNVDIGEDLMKRLFNCCIETSLEKYPSLHEFSTCDLANCCWALATTGLYHRRFFDAVEKEVINRLERCLAGQCNDWVSFCSFEIASVVWAFAACNRSSKRLIDTVSSYLTALCCRDGKDSLSVQSIVGVNLRETELGNLAWACSVMNYFPFDLMRIIYRGLVGEGPNERNLGYMSQFYEGSLLSTQTATSLVYTQVSMEISGCTNGFSLPLDFLEGWCSLLSPTNHDGNFMMTTTSRTQQGVCESLNRMGFQHVEEYAVPLDFVFPSVVGVGSLLSLDVADPERKIGLEVDGPSHYMHDMESWSPHDKPTAQWPVSYANRSESKRQWSHETQIMTGATALKNRLMEGLGWKVVHLPFWEWIAQDFDPEREDELCRNLIQQEG